jgi:hypothetical protein
VPSPWDLEPGISYFSACCHQKIDAAKPGGKPKSRDILRRFNPFATTKLKYVTQVDTIRLTVEGSEAQPTRVVFWVCQKGLKRKCLPNAVSLHGVRKLVRNEAELATETRDLPPSWLMTDVAAINKS